MRHQRRWIKKTILSIGFLASSILVSAAAGRSGQEQPPSEKQTTSTTLPPASSPRPVSMRAKPFSSTELLPKVKRYYQLVWGVDNLGVKILSSGLMVRFSYRVVDANKAKALNNKDVDPFLFDENTKAKLVVPTMEKVGQLRQSSPPENGHEYWMVFSNKGEYVKPGSRVDVVIGNFRVEGLVVE